MGLFLGFGLWRRLVFDSLAIFGQTLPSPPNQLYGVRSALLRRHLRDLVRHGPRDVDLLLLPPQIRPAPRQPQLGRPDIGRQMLLMRHDDRATFGRALEDLDRRHRHAAGAVVEAFRNLGIRLDLAVFDGDTKLRMPRLPRNPPR
jgi:hypothetical protein